MLRDDLIYQIFATCDCLHQRELLFGEVKDEVGDSATIGELGLGVSQLVKEGVSQSLHGCDSAAWIIVQKGND